ncbi:hypothetical protein GLOIN_2v1777499 [Rhizophagus clarus]|uniref:Uncharacterized protein n=1 Tax=Rhizophagus clarus TaxID=94130 RepID=A0A8H3LQS3_9GLOM|nr:hypothetical protein GLOIN_2v1777499 [Rhizophagus clarus]
MLTDCKNFEALYNLNWNVKFRKDNILIDWKKTLFTLSSSTYDINSTSFEELLLKSFKIKLFMNKLLTLEHTETYFYYLYSDANCFLCGDSLEDLSHIWLCPEVIRVTQHEILSLPIWNLSSSDIQVTFIDILRGFISHSLSKLLERFLSSFQVEALLKNLSN